MKLPYAVVYVDRGLAGDGLAHYLNLQWKDGWDYVAHLAGTGPKQGILMKKRDVPGLGKIYLSLMSLWDGKNLTESELFASFTRILSDDPSELANVRAMLGRDTEVKEHFEEWLRGLVKDRPAIRMSSGSPVAVSDELLEVLAKEKKGR
jgi:hypothetical protein